MPLAHALPLHLFLLLLLLILPIQVQRRLDLAANALVVGRVAVAAVFLLVHIAGAAALVGLALVVCIYPINHRVGGEGGKEDGKMKAGEDHRRGKP